jgi:hypothetical protein
VSRPRSRLGGTFQESTRHRDSFRRVGIPESPRNSRGPEGSSRPADASGFSDPLAKTSQRRGK